MKFLSAIATVAGFTALSRVAGFARDMLMAVILGAGPMADAFVVALKLPNLFRRVTAEGAFSVSFIPMYTEALEKDGEEEAGTFASQVLSVMGLVLGVFTMLAFVAMPYIIHVIAPGFTAGSEQFVAAVDLSRITFPYLLLISVTALFGGMLNTHHRFGPFAAAPILFNLCLISALLLSQLFSLSAATALAYGVLCSGFLQCGMLYYFVRKYNYVLVYKPPAFTAKIKQLFKLMGPGVIGAGIAHINLFIDMIIASLLGAGSISVMYYADRLNQLPLGIVGVAVGTALLPLMSKAMMRDDKASEEETGKMPGSEAAHLFNRALELSLFLTVPAAAGLYMLSYPIIEMLFQHGAFTVESAVLSAKVLSFYTIGLPAFVMTKVYSTAFWGRKDTSTPVKVSVVSTAVNVGLSLFFVFVMDLGVAGIACGTAVAAWVQLLGLSFVLHRKESFAFDAQFKRTVFAVLVAVVAMAALLFCVKPFVLTQLDLGRVLNVFLLVGSGGVVFASFFFPLSGIKPQDVKRLFKGQIS